MTHEVYSHDTDVDVVHKYNAIELKGWINQLQYIDKEIDKLLNLYAKSVQNGKIPENMAELFSKRKETNTQIYETVLRYSNIYSKAAECEDIQCDMAYLSEYERLRKSYQYHLARYQKLKDHLYDHALQNQ